MTADEIVELISNMEMVNPPFPVRLSARKDCINSRGGKRYAVYSVAILRYEMDVTHRVTGEPFTTSGEKIIWEGCSRDSVIETVFNFIMVNFEHEASEAFHVDGERVFDPHK